MSERPDTEELLQRIVRDGRARRRVPRVRAMLAVTAALSAAVTALYLRFGAGLRPDLAPRLTGDFFFAAIWLGLVVLSVGAVLWAVAEGIPGRVALQRVGRGLALAGALLGFVLAPLTVLLHTGGGALQAGSGELMCVGGAFRLAALPYAALVAWVLWAAPARPLRTALGAAVGAGAIGALVVHVTCPDSHPAHWMMGHGLAPLLAAVAVALPAWALVHWQRGRRQRPL